MAAGKPPKLVLHFRCFEPSALCLVVFLFLSDTLDVLSFNRDNTGSSESIAIDIWSTKAQYGLLRPHSSETVANMRGISCNSAAPVMQEDRLANGLGHLSPIQGFWFYAHTGSDMPRTHKHPGMQYPSHVTKREADQSVERHQYSLLSKSDQMRTYSKTWEMAELF